VTPPDPAVAEALDALVARVVAAVDLRTDHDPHWPSPCERGAPDADDRIAWVPTPRADYGALDPLAETLGRPLHPSLRTFWGHLWSDGLPCRSAEGEVHLLGVWNLDDHERLLANLLGHAQQQKRRRRAPTFFFACTEDDSDLILSVDEATGAVVLEEPGQAPRRVVEDALAPFLARLEPLV
jgi:SecY interacting protein Syd